MNALPATTGNVDRRWSQATFGLTILLSAFLLFQVQPLVSKSILPWFGGSPAVWTTCMLFFQMLLLGGYVYAHLLQSRLSPRSQVAVHLLLVIAALVVLPIAPSPALKPVDGTSPTWRILLLLTVTVGLPYFALSATSPLVQAWFSSSLPGRSPYRLYAISNFGSLAALLSYPFLFEPVLDLRQQSALWSGAFVFYTVLCAATLACVWRPRERVKEASLFSLRENRQNGTAPCLLRENRDSLRPIADRIDWVALPACASLMLLAATNHVCQDVAVVPLLWVVPLSLYLLSYIICFDHARWYIRPLWAALAVLALAGVVANDYHDLDYPMFLSLPQQLVLYFAALLFSCMVCHGELARLKPDPRHLTEYYMYIAAGGALGGLFVAIVAPLLFSTYFEWQIGVAASAVLSLGLLIRPGTGRHTRPLRYALFGLVVAAGLAYLGQWAFGLDRPVDQARGFFGVITVVEREVDSTGRPVYHEFVLNNGRITHGCQSAEPAKRHWPTSYYGDQSGVGRALHYLEKAGPLRVGAIGLGVGTLAAYARPGDVFRFYEINPDVLRMARQHFTYLADCRGTCDVVMGDARISLERQPPQHFDLLVVDAFSGDAIPTHLLTCEAFDVYRRHLAPNGVVAVHISNTFLRLAPVVRRLAEHIDMRAVRICNVDDDDHLVNASQWMLATGNDGFLRANPSDPPESDDDQWRVPLWTDHYSNLFQILAGGITESH